MIDAILTNAMLPHISGAFLNRLLAGNPAMRLHMGADSAGLTYAFDLDAIPAEEPASVAAP